MAKLTRKSAKLFAENATAAVGGLAQFGSLAAGNPNYTTDPDVIQALPAYGDGWSAAVRGNKSPAMEDRNALDYLLSYQQAYIMQRGIPEWLSTETYYQGSFASKADGKLFVSKVDNNIGNDPDSDSTETYWIKFPTPAELASGYVHLAGDTMTGTLNAPDINATNSMTSPTPGDSSNSTAVATTAFVRNVMQKYGPAMNAGVSFTSGSTLPVSALVVVYGNVGSYAKGSLSIDGHQVACDTNNEGTARQHGVNAIARAGSKITFSGFSSVTAIYYPLRIS